jgi:hypothetical protein
MAIFVMGFKAGVLHTNERKEVDVSLLMLVSLKSIATGLGRILRCSVWTQATAKIVKFVGTLKRPKPDPALRAMTKTGKSCIVPHRRAVKFW